MLGAGEEKILASLIEHNPSERDAMIDYATQELGVAYVFKALEILEQKRPEVAKAPQQASPAETKAPADTAAPEATPPAMVEKQVEDVKPEAKADSPAQKEPEEKQPGWVVRARAYNRAHAGDVSTFNIGTQNSCVDPATGEVDPYKVAQWQADNGVPPDGRVGPKTAQNAMLTK